LGASVETVLDEDGHGGCGGGYLSLRGFSCHVERSDCSWSSGRVYDYS
jgi:hypothetical protein